MNILSGIITVSLSIALGVFFFFFLLLALNGFTGKAGEYAIYFYIGWAIIFSIIFAAASFFGTNLLLQKPFNKALSVIIPVIISTILAGGAHFLGIIVSAIVAQEIWKK
jgi:hypothetical protein